MGNFSRGFFVGMVFILLCLSNVAFAVQTTQQSDSTAFIEKIFFADDPANPLIPSPPATTPPTTPSAPDTTGASDRTGAAGADTTSGQGACSVSKLSATEAKAIMDLTHNGFSGKEIGNGESADKGSEGVNLEGLELVSADNDNNVAMKVSPPTQASQPGAFGVLSGKKITGPWGLGLVLDDTLRVGRCDYPTSEQDKCKVYQNGLLYRTSGAGIKSDLVNAIDSVKDAAVRNAKGITEEEYARMQTNMFDGNNSTAVSVEPTEKIKNSMLVSSYTARNATNCLSNQCKISTYSAFDKYYNSWMTADLVVSNLGPAMLHKASKVLSKVYKTRAAKEPIKSKFSLIPRIRDKFVGIPTEIAYRDRWRAYNAIVNEEGFGDLMKPLTIERSLFSSGANNNIYKLTDPSSPIFKLSPEKKSKFFEAVEHLRSYARGNAMNIEEATKAFEAGQLNKIEYAQEVGKWIVDWDDTVLLDTPAWMKDNDALFGFVGLAVKKGGYPADQGYVDIATAAPFNFKRIIKKFDADASWSGWGNSAEEFVTDGANLKLYKIQPKEPLVQNASVEQLREHILKLGQGNVSVGLPDGRYLPLTTESIDLIANNPTLPGHVTVYRSGYVEVAPLTPDDFANRITDSRLVGRPTTAVSNLDDLHNALVQNDFMERKSLSALDKLYAREGDLIKNYYKDPRKGLLYGAVEPILFWEFKRGFGNEGYSAYMLPDTWTTITIKQGSDPLYKDSYTDFFANEGSDEGDLFKRAYNSFPLIWNKLLVQAVEISPTAKGLLAKIPGDFFSVSGMRDEVKDVAFYSHNENCSGCSLALDVQNSYMKSSFIAPVSLQGFLVEAADAEVISKEGSTLISFTHHSDLEGKTTDLEGGGINLVDGQLSDETCDDVLRKAGLGWAGTGAGGVLALAENLLYTVNLGAGLAGSFFMQMNYGRELQDCVDDKLGYYVHFYTPPAAMQKTGKTKEVLSNETVSSTLQKMTESIDKSLSNTSNPLTDSLKKANEQFKDFAGQAQNNNLLQSTLQIGNPSNGTLLGKEVFYIWYLETASPSEYKTTGKMVITDGNTKVEVNYATGETKINGKTVLGADKADHTRMITSDNRVPGEIIPVTLNKASSPENDSPVFEVGANGQVKVVNSEILSCVQKAVKDQSGITYSGNELTQVFGALTGVKTANYASVFVRDGIIHLEGEGPRVDGDGSSKFIIDGFWKSYLKMDANKSVDAGKFVGMTFEHGEIVLKEETNEIIIKLRQHAEAVLSNSEVAGLKGKLTTVNDPETDCDVPAVELEAQGHPGDELGLQRVNNFNTSMKHLGPFTQFTTDSKIYEFYSKRDGNNGECKDYFRVIDRATGKVITDQEIVGGIKQLEDGTITFKTADGKTQTLKFDAENGVPKVTYNGGAPETLRTAQGPNGSFWYDPNTGLWYPENGLQIPLSQAFKDNGTMFGSDGKGNVVGTPTNPITFNVGAQKDSGFNIPSLPETALGIVAFVALFLMLSYAITQRRVRTRRRK